MKNIIMLFAIIILSCGQKEEDYKLIATCDKIIVQDTVVNHTINFLVSYKNPYDFDITFFANSYAPNHINKRYEKIGVFLNFNNSDTPLGQFHPLNKFVIEAGKTLKVLYTYSDKYPNIKIPFNKSESYKSQIKRARLYYKFDQTLMTKAFEKEENYIKSDFAIDISKANIEFKKRLDIEEAIRLVDGKINGK